VIATTYLAFDDEATRATAWGDLLADARPATEVAATTAKSACAD
jgi:hypothetical protein